jgi:hypothetical protein
MKVTVTIVAVSGMATTPQVVNPASPTVLQQVTKPQGSPATLRLV